MKTRLLLLAGLIIGCVLLPTAAFAYSYYQDIRILDARTFANISRQDPNIPLGAYDTLQLARQLPLNEAVAACSLYGESCCITAT